jgi:hypothetical protein
VEHRGDQIFALEDAGDDDSGDAKHRENDDRPGERDVDSFDCPVAPELVGRASENAHGDERERAVTDGDVRRAQRRSRRRLAERDGERERRCTIEPADPSRERSSTRLAES